MRKNMYFLICSSLIMGSIFVFTSSCKKDDNNGENGNNKGIPVLITTAVTNITQTTASSGGNITFDGGATVTVHGVCWSTEQTPTISDNKTTDRTGAGNFISNISGLTANTTYYVRAYATNKNGTGYGDAMSFITQQGISHSSFTDSRDGNVYQFVTIGNQTWMAENLKYLPSVNGGSATASTSAPYYYVNGYFGTNVNIAKQTANYQTYGVLYNWPAAMPDLASSAFNPSGVKGVCPTGWHLPSYAEWTELIEYLGGVTVAGGKLKEIGTTHWHKPNYGATNETGFTALPGGYWESNGTDIGRFSLIGSNGIWWSATERPHTHAWAMFTQFSINDVACYDEFWTMGFSVRCVRD